MAPQATSYAILKIFGERYKQGKQGLRYCQNNYRNYAYYGMSFQALIEVKKHDLGVLK